MGIELGNLVFEGPYTSNNKIADEAGLYAIHCYDQGRYKLIDIGEAYRLQSTIKEHHRIKCWQRNCQGILTVSVYYTPHWQRKGRVKFVNKIREQFEPPCGSRINNSE
ncbi:MAG: hypothetical protein ACOCZ3_01245 [Bacillota bacterium]